MRVAPLPAMHGGRAQQSANGENSGHAAEAVVEGVAGAAHGTDRAPSWKKCPAKPGIFREKNSRCVDA